jgi:hypothetical protein
VAQRLPSGGQVVALLKEPSLRRVREAHSAHVRGIVSAIGEPRCI